MSKKDKPKIEILPRIDEGREVTSRKGNLPQLPMPPSGAIKIALVTAFRYKSTQQAIRAYNQAVDELAETELALARLDKARAQRQRAIRLLEDVEDIHEADRLARKQQVMEAEQRRDDAERERIEAKQKLADQKADAEIAEFLRQQRVQKARAAHERFLNKEGGSSVDLDDLTEDQDEFVKDLELEIQGPRYMEITEEIIKKFKAEKKGTPTQKDEEYFELIREAAKRLIGEKFS